jgi:hypothetical protein
LFEFNVSRLGVTLVDPMFIEELEEDEAMDQHFVET